MKRWRCVNNNHVDGKANQFGCKVGKPAARRAALKDDIATLDVPQFMQTPPKRLLKQRIVDEFADRGNPSALLPLSDERRKNETDTENDREPDQSLGHLG